MLLVCCISLDSVVFHSFITKLLYSRLSDVTFEAFFFKFNDITMNLSLRVFVILAEDSDFCDIKNKL